MIINHNIAAEKASRHFGMNVRKMDATFEVLSSGERINSAADDPAGLAVSEKMRTQVRGLSQAQRNIQDGISLIQTAEGFLREANDILQRMRELSVQAANGTYTGQDRAQINVEFDQMLKELNRLHEDAKFNTIRLFDGYSTGKNSFGENESGEINPSRNINFNNPETGSGKSGIVIQSGANTDERTFVKMDTINSYELGLTAQPTETYTNNDNLAYREFSFFDATPQAIEDMMYLESSIMPSALESMDGKVLSIDFYTPKEGTRVDLSTTEDATETISVIDVALHKVNKQRANLGSYQNRLETTMRGVQLTRENIQSAESRIRDADMAESYVELTKESILSQSSASMLAQANHNSSMILRVIG